MEENDPFATNQPPEVPAPPAHDELPPSPLGDAPSAAPVARPAELATPGKRLLARIVDVLVLIIPLVILSFVTGGGYIYTVVALIAVGAYEILMISSRGQTIGKMALSIKVVDETTGEIPDIQASGMRYGVAQIWGLIPVIGAIITLVVYLSLLWRERRQGFHDMVAKTIVVEA